MTVNYFWELNRPGRKPKFWSEEKNRWYEDGAKATLYADKGLAIEKEPVIGMGRSLGFSLKLNEVSIYGKKVVWTA